MKKYSKPIVIAVDELAQGIFAASGCYYPSARIHQKPQCGRGDYRIQVDAKHDADHQCETQVVTLRFNMPVQYVSSNGSVVGSGNGDVIRIAYHYWNNRQDQIGFGDVVVTADQGLVVMGINIQD